MGGGPSAVGYFYSPNAQKRLLQAKRWSGHAPE